MNVLGLVVYGKSLYLLNLAVYLKNKVLPKEKIKQGNVDIEVINKIKQ